MCDEYRKQLEGEFGDKVGVVELSLLDKAVFMWMRNWIERNLKRDVSSYRHVCNCFVCAELRFLWCRMVSWCALVKWHWN